MPKFISCLQCVIYLCETMERTETSLPQNVFEIMASSRECLESLFTGTVLDQSLLKKVEGQSPDILSSHGRIQKTF